MATTSNNTIYFGIIGLVLILIAAGSGYVAGDGHGKKSVTTSTDTTATTSQLDLNSGGAIGGPGGTTDGRSFRGGPGGPGGAGGGFVAGTVSAVNGDQITVTGRDGTTSSLTISGSTTISKTVTGSSGDVSVGESVTAIGTPAADGSVDATTLQIRPAGSATDVTAGAL